MPCDAFRRNPTHQNLNQIASLEALYLPKSRCYLMSYDFQDWPFHTCFCQKKPMLFDSMRLRYTVPYPPGSLNHVHGPPHPICPPSPPLRHVHQVDWICHVRHVLHVCRIRQVYQVCHVHHIRRVRPSTMSATSIISSAFGTEPQADFDPLAHAISITSQKI